MLFGTYLVRKGIISPLQFVEAMERQQSRRPALGELALRERILSMKQVFAVLAQQAETNQPFGRIARDLDFLTEDELARLLLLQSEQTASLTSILEELGAADSALLNAELNQFHREASGFHKRSAPQPDAVCA